jgi:hypothetical protein
MQAHRLIKLFQRKADDALDMLVTQRVQFRGNDPQDLILKARLQAIHEAWSKAADMLRKEELK